MRKVCILVIILLLLPTLAYSQKEQTKQAASDYIRSGWELVGLDRVQEANESFKEAVAQEPNNIKALEGLAQTYMYLDRNKEAEEIYNKILELEPENINAIIALAKIYSWNNRYEESIELYKKALEINPKDAKAGLAEVYNWAGYRTESVAQYEEILAEDPRNIKAYKGLAEVHVWDDRLKEAQRIYQEALELFPDSIDLRLGLAKIYGLMAYWTKAEEEYQKVLDIDPNNIEAQEGIENARKELATRQEFIFGYIYERDANNWKAHTFNYGYKNTRFFDYGHNIYGAYYLSDLRETGHTHSLGNIIELGGKYNVNSLLTVLGSTDIRTYSHGLNFFAGADIGAILKYYARNTLTVKYTRDVFDPLDEIRTNRYAVESNAYLNRQLLLTNSYTYNTYSNSNSSTDSYHFLDFIISEKEPDLSIGFGFRRRDFKEPATEYYSPQDLESKIYSIYWGRLYEKDYLYGNFKFIENSDHIDNYYYLIGNEHIFNDDCSLSGEISYFDTEAKYYALTTTFVLRLRF